MKVAVVSTLLTRAGGGVSEAVRLMATSVRPRADVAIHALRDPDSDDMTGWEALDVTLYDLVPPRRYALSFGLLGGLLRSDADLVHIHGLWQFPTLAVWIWSLIKKKPYVVTPHGMLEPWILARSRTLKKIISWSYQDRFLRGATAIHVLTQKERDNVASYTNGQIVTEIPNYVPPAVPTSEKPKWWRPAFDGRTVYLFFGRLHEKKSCAELAGAWGRLCRNDAGFRARSALVFCGWNDGLEGFEELVAGLEQELGNILFAGPQYGEDKTRTYSAADFFILPSKSEGLPMAILEAWSAGLPAIITPECNLSVGFHSGAAIETGTSEDAIIASLKKADALPPEARSTMSARAQALVEAEYSQEKVGGDLIALYGRCLSPQGSRGPHA